MNYGAEESDRYNLLRLLSTGCQLSPKRDGSSQTKPSPSPSPCVQPSASRAPVHEPQSSERHLLAQPTPFSLLARSVSSDLLATRFRVFRLLSALPHCMNIWTSGAGETWSGGVNYLNCRPKFQLSRYVVTPLSGARPLFSSLPLKPTYLRPTLASRHCYPTMGTETGSSGCAHTRSILASVFNALCSTKTARPVQGRLTFRRAWSARPLPVGVVSRWARVPIAPCAAVRLP